MAFGLTPEVRAANGFKPDMRRSEDRDNEEAMDAHGGREVEPELLDECVEVGHPRRAVEEVGLGD
jgi:hypothetical protein